MTTTTKTYFAMFTDEGNAEVARLVGQMLTEWAIVADDISKVVRTWERYVEAEHPEFCEKHREYSDTAVRDEVYVYLEDRLSRKFTNLVESGPLTDAPTDDEGTN